MAHWYSKYIKPYSLPAFIFAIVLGVAYWPSLTHEFAYTDDYSYLLDGQVGMQWGNEMFSMGGRPLLGFLMVTFFNHWNTVEEAVVITQFCFLILLAILNGTIWSFYPLRGKSVSIFTVFLSSYFDSSIWSIRNLGFLFFLSIGRGIWIIIRVFVRRRLVGRP